MQVNLIPDQIVAGRLRIIGEIGMGGFGHVYKAWDQQFERTVALKLVTLGPHADQEFLDRFLREAKISSALLHNNIARTYSYGLLDSVTPYVVLEYVEGKSLGDLLYERGKLAPTQAIEIAIGVLDALQYAHGEGVVHRDIKPENIVVSEDLTKIKIIDFGLARRYDVDSTLTKVGFLQGTPQFMSPEQIRGGLVDGRTDLYAMACMLCLMISGSLPFNGSTDLEYMYMHLNSQPQLPELPVCVAESILRGLAKNRDERFATASEFASELSHFLNGPESLLESVPPSPPNPLYRKKQVLLPVVIVATVCLSVAMLDIFKLLKSNIPVPLNAATVRQTARDNKYAEAVKLDKSHNYVEAARAYRQFIDEFCNDNTDRVEVVRSTCLFVSAAFAAAIPVKNWKGYAARAIKLCEKMDSGEIKACERDLHLNLAKAYGAEGDRPNCIEECEMACGLSEKYPLVDGSSHSPHLLYSEQLRSWSSIESEALPHYKSAIKMLRRYRHAHGQTIFDEDVYSHFLKYKVVGKEQFWVEIADELENEATTRDAHDAVKRLVSAACIDSKMQRTSKALQLFERATTIAAKSGYAALEAYTYNARVGAIPMTIDDEIALNMKAYSLVAPHKDRIDSAVAVAAHLLAQSYADAGRHSEAARFFQIACEFDLKTAQQSQLKGNIGESWTYLYKLLGIAGPRACWELREHGCIRQSVEFGRKQKALAAQSRNDPAFSAYIGVLDQLEDNYDILLKGHRPY